MGMSRRYTDEMIAAALAECGQCSMLAAEKLGCTRVTIWKFRDRRGDVFDLSTRRYVPSPKRGRKLRTPDQMAVALESNKGVITRTARQLGISGYSVRQFAIEVGYIKPPDPTRRRLIPYAGAPRRRQIPAENRA
jgi:transcriptional regulator of acetoin/glycerol metabolism